MQNCSGSWKRRNQAARLTSTLACSILLPWAIRDPEIGQRIRGILLDWLAESSEAYQTESVSLVDEEVQALVGVVRRRALEGAYREEGLRAAFDVSGDRSEKK